MNQLEMAANNFAEFSQMAANRTQAKWRRVANNIDRWCRKWVPLAYILGLFVIYMLEFDDRWCRRM